MNAKQFFSKFFSFLAMATFLVSCSQNENDATTTTKNASTKANRLAESQNVAKGNLIIKNNTNYAFKDILVASHGNGTINRLSQKIIINPNTVITLTNYHDTHLLGIDYFGDDKWEIMGVGGTTGVAANGAYMTLDPDGNPYVQWIGMNTNNGVVDFSFKIGGDDVEVNPVQGSFSTTGVIEPNGDVIITLND